MIRKLSITRKILLIPLVGAAGFIFYVMFSVMAVNDAVEKLDVAQDQQFPLMLTAESNRVRLDKIKNTLSSAVSAGEAEKLTQANTLAEAFRSDFKDVNVQDDATRREIEDILKDFDAYYSLASSLSKDMVEGSADFSKVGERADKMSSMIKQLDTRLDGFYEDQRGKFKAAFDNANQEAANIANVGILAAVVTLGALLAVAIPISRVISKSMDEVVDRLRTMAQTDGDLTIRISTNSQDEVGDLVYWFNSFVEKLQQVIRQLVESAVPLAELSETVHNLSGRMQKSLGQQDEYAAQSQQAMEEMSRSVAEIAESAAEAANAASNANQHAEQGNRVVGETVSGINSLSQRLGEAAEVVGNVQQHTDKVSGVLDVIKGIAEQTNLLALNAAIEAARAGEQGRGFAVVADEVRALASRTQDSTEEITETLKNLQEVAQRAVADMQNSTEVVQSNVDKVGHAGETLQSITGLVDTITSMNQQIATATEQQESLSRDMVNQVNQIREQTKEGATDSDELKGVSERLDVLARELKAVAGQFRV
ncbi:methyl-accepting chemotaxis protein [Tamilnaduibacter salinus]|uniref:Methyl-accepting chemotaxis protein n=2 Tax=Tamilnaduibacter salinus TaxID=1484056 RepID=A0A2U1CYX4_9GAMM|nr:methyl-accepting chemotaxis protein [Tamilnaduibacter salinus]PVY77982.1 methyl-accepting chemotaxis protein [Tamilnaduibacter salinus]